MTTEPQNTNYEPGTTNYLIMQNKPNFLRHQMNINFYLTSCYKQKSPLRPPPKQTQSKPIKPNPTPLFGPKIGLENSKAKCPEPKCKPAILPPQGFTSEKLMAKPLGLRL